MKALLRTLVGIAAITVISTARRVNPTQYHKRRHLMELTRKDHQELLVPILDEDTNSYSHHVQIEDERNKHLEFHFEAVLHPNTHVLALTDEGHRANITGFVCGDHDLKLYPIDADYYHEHIQSKLDSNKHVFIPDVCRGKSHPAEVRKIHSIRKDGDGLSLESTTSDHLDMYQEYFLEFKSDAPVGVHDIEADDHDALRRRRLSSCNPGYSHHDDEDFAIELVENLALLSGKIKKALNVLKFLRDLLDILAKIFDKDQQTIDEDIGPGINCEHIVHGMEMGDDGGECSNCYFSFDFGVHLMMKKAVFGQELAGKPLEWAFTLNADAVAAMEITSDVRIDAHTKSIHAQNPIKIVDGISVFGLQLNVHLLPSVSFAAGFEAEGKVSFEFGAKKNQGFRIGLQNPKKNFGMPRFVHQIPPTIRSNKLEITGAEVTETTLRLATRIVFALTFVDILEIDFIVEPHVNILLRDPHTDENSDCAKYWSSTTYADWHVRGKVLWPIAFDLPKLKLGKKPTRNYHQSKPHCLLEKDFGYVTKGADDIWTRRRRLSNVPQLASLEYSTDFNAIDFVPHYGISSSWGIMNTMWWANMTSLTDLCSDNYGAACEGFPVPPEGILSLEYFSEYMLLGTYETSFEMPVYHNTSWFDVSYINRTHLNKTSALYVEFNCITTLNFTQTSTYWSEANLYEYDVNIIDWYCDMIGTNHSLNIADESWKCMMSLPPKMNVIALDVSFNSILLFDDASWCRVFPLTLQDGYILDSQHFNFEYVSQLWYGSFHCDVGTALKIVLYFTVIEEDGTVGCVLEFEGEKTNYLEGKVDFDAMTMRLNDTYDYSTSQSTGGVIQFIGVLTVLIDGTILYSGSVKGLGCTGFVIVGQTSIVEYNMSNSTNSTITEYNMSTTDYNGDDDTDSNLMSFDAMVNDYALYWFIATISFMMLFICAIVCMLCRSRAKHQHDEAQSAHTL